MRQRLLPTNWKDAMLPTTQETINFILSRDAFERSHPGDALVRDEVVGYPTGKVHFVNKSHPGPLDGQPEHKWAYVAHYASGKTTTVWGPGGREVGVGLAKA